MAAFTGTQYDNFKPELWSTTLNFSLKNALVGRQLVNTNYQGEITGMGDTVHILEPGGVTSRAYTAYSDMTVEQPSETDRTLVIDQGDYFAFDVDDIDQAQGNVDLREAHMQEAAFSLGDTMDTFIFQMYTSAGSGVASDHANSDALASTSIYGDFVDAAFVLDSQDVPKQGRWAAISPSETAALREAGQLAPVDDSSNNRVGGGTSAAAGVVATGNIPQGSVAGFQVFETNNLTTLSGVRKVLFGHPRATTFATQVAQIEGVRRELRFADLVKGLQVYGRATIRSEALAVKHYTA